MSGRPNPGLDDWRALAATELRGANPDTLAWQTPEGIVIKSLFAAADLEGLIAPRTNSL